MNKVEITKVLQEIIWQMDFALLKHGEDYFMEFIDDNDLGHFYSDLYLDEYKDGFALFRSFCSKMLVFDALLDSWKEENEQYVIFSGTERLCIKKSTVEEFK